MGDEQSLGQVADESAANLPDLGAPPVPAENPGSSPTLIPAFLSDATALAEFIDRARQSGVRALEHPCGFKLSFEPSLRPPQGAW